METLKTQNCQSSPEEKEQNRRHNLPDRYNNQNNIHWHKNRYKDQWKRIESPEINPYNYGQLIFDKERQNMIGKKTYIYDKTPWNSQKRTLAKYALT